jgi:hypothetical protein
MKNPLVGTVTEVELRGSRFRCRLSTTSVVFPTAKEVADPPELFFKFDAYPHILGYLHLQSGMSKDAVSNLRPHLSSRVYMT